MAAGTATASEACAAMHRLVPELRDLFATTLAAGIDIEPFVSRLFVIAYVEGVMDASAAVLSGEQSNLFAAMTHDAGVSL